MSDESFPHNSGQESNESRPSYEIVMRNRTELMVARPSEYHNEMLETFMMFDEDSPLYFAVPIIGRFNRDIDTSWGSPKTYREIGIGVRGLRFQRLGFEWALDMAVTSTTDTDWQQAFIDADTLNNFYELQRDKVKDASLKSEDLITAARDRLFNYATPDPTLHLELFNNVIAAAAAGPEKEVLHKHFSNGVMTAIALIELACNEVAPLTISEEEIYTFLAKAAQADTDQSGSDEA